MSDYFSLLAARLLGASSDVRPALRARFEPDLPNPRSATHAEEPDGRFSGEPAGFREVVSRRDPLFPRATESAEFARENPGSEATLPSRPAAWDRNPDHSFPADPVPSTPTAFAPPTPTPGQTPPVQREPPSGPPSGPAPNPIHPNEYRTSRPSHDSKPSESPSSNPSDAVPPIPRYSREPPRVPLLEPSPSTFVARPELLEPVPRRIRVSENGPVAEKPSGNRRNSDRSGEQRRDADAPPSQFGPGLSRLRSGRDRAPDHEPSAPRSIEISIGRIEVQAMFAPTSEPAKSPRRESAGLSLESYLERRNGGGRRNE